MEQYSNKNELCTFSYFLKSFNTISRKKAIVSQTENDVVVQGEPHSAWGNLGARAECLRCRPTSGASCRPCSSCTAPSRPPPGRARRPPPPGRTPWWPSRATAWRGPASKPQGLKSAEQKSGATCCFIFSKHSVTLGWGAVIKMISEATWRGFHKEANRKLPQLHGDESYRNYKKLLDSSLRSAFCFSGWKIALRGFRKSKEKEKSRNGMLSFHGFTWIVHSLI